MAAGEVNYVSDQAKQQPKREPRSGGKRAQRKAAERAAANAGQQVGQPENGQAVETSQGTPVQKPKEKLVGPEKKPTHDFVVGDQILLS